MINDKIKKLLFMAGVLVTIIFYSVYWLYEYLKINPSINEFVAYPDLNLIVIAVGTIIIWLPIILYTTPKD